MSNRGLATSAINPHTGAPWSAVDTWYCASRGDVAWRCKDCGAWGIYLKVQANPWCHVHNCPALLKQHFVNVWGDTAVAERLEDLPPGPWYCGNGVPVSDDPPIVTDGIRATKHD